NLQISDFRIDEGSLILREKKNEKEINSFKNLSITLSDLDFDLSSKNSLNKNFYLNKDFQFELSDYEVKLSDSLNILKIGLTLLANDYLKLKDVALITRYVEYQYTTKVGYQTDVAKVNFSEIVYPEINVEILISEKVLEAGSVTLTDVTAIVFRDKRYKMKTDLAKGMPQELMMNGLLEIMLDSLIVNNASVTYREFPENGLIPGELRFMDLDAVMSPFIITKDPKGYPISSSFLTASALLNGHAVMGMNATLSYQAPFPIDIEAEVGE